jgi:hypothetical protein
MRAISMTRERTRFYGDAPSETQSELSAPKFVAIGLLLAGRPYTDVASEVGIDVTTLHRWRAEPAFVAELRSQFELMREASLCGLFSMAAESINALRSALRSQSEPARVSAAQTVLDRLGIRERPASSDQKPEIGARVSTGAELEARARETVLKEFRGLDDEQLVRRVRALLAGEQH